MFLQVGVTEKNRNLLRILWYKDDVIGGPIIKFSFVRVPYGLNCSQSLVLYIFYHTIEMNLNNVDPKVQLLAQKNFFVDECKRT